MLHQGVPTCCWQWGVGRHPALPITAESPWTSCLPFLGSSVSVRDTSFASNTVLDPEQNLIYWLPCLTVQGAWLQVQTDPGSKGSARLLHSIFRAVCPRSGSRVPLSRERIQAPPLHSRCPAEVKELHPRIPSIPGPEVLPWHSQHRTLILHGACEWEVKCADQS